MSSEPWRGHKVLIVDDCARVRDELGQFYQELGLEVVGSAKSGVEALEQMQSVEVDLVSLDIIMPEMDGVECYRRLAASGFSGKVCVISWLASDAVIIEKLEKTIPSQLCARKPMDVDSLRILLEHVYGVRSVREPRSDELDGTGLDELTARTAS